MFSCRNPEPSKDQTLQLCCYLLVGIENSPSHPGVRRSGRNSFYSVLNFSLREVLAVHFTSSLEYCFWLSLRKKSMLGIGFEKRQMRSFYSFVT